MLRAKTGSKYPSESSVQILEPIINMEFSLDPQMEEIFKNVFEFYGTLNPHGNVITLTGKIFEKTFTNPKMLTGHRFADTAFWQSSEQNYQIINSAIEAAGQGIKSKQILEFRISADEIRVVEVSLSPIFDEQNSQKLK